jgi:hypothetical protein
MGCIFLLTCTDSNLFSFFVLLSLKSRLSYTVLKLSWAVHDVDSVFVLVVFFFLSFFFFFCFAVGIIGVGISFCRVGFLLAFVH